VAPEDLDNTAESDDTLDDLDLDAALDGADDGLDGMDLDDVLNAGPDDLDGDSPAQPFDFKRPQNISRRFEQNLQNVAENLAKTSTITFTSLLRTGVVVDYEGVRLSSFDSYKEEMPNPTCAAMLTLAPLKGQSLFHLDIGIAFVFLQRLMGGPPEAEDAIREFTEIERGVMANLSTRLANMFRDAAQKLLHIEPAFVSIENNPAYLSGITGGDSLIVLKFMIKLEGVEGPMEIGMPIPAFAPVREIFDPEERLELRSSAEARDDRLQIMETLQGTTSEVVVQLGEVSTSLEAVMKLQAGDIVQLKQPVDAPLKVMVEGKEVFTGQAGRLNQARAVRLLEKVNEE